MPDASTPARQIVETEIRANGPITFARFMEIALYGEQGYYTSSVNAGADYATSPQMHPAFGALIAGYLFRAWQSLLASRTRLTLWSWARVTAGWRVTCSMLSKAVGNSMI